MQFLERVERNEHVDLDQFVFEHPECDRDELRLYLEAIVQVDGIAPTKSTFSGETEDEEIPAEVDSRYEVKGILGRGGMGIVFLVRDRDMGRQVALKVVRKFRAEERFRPTAAVPRRGADLGAPRAPEHRAGLRPRPDAGWTHLLHDALGAGANAGRDPRSAREGRHRDHRSLRPHAPAPDLLSAQPRRGLRARSGHRPPRPEAGQRDDRAVRRSAHAGLGARASDRRRHQRLERGDRRHPRLHVSRADPCGTGGCGERRVRPRSDPAGDDDTQEGDRRRDAVRPHREHGARAALRAPTSTARFLPISRR